jgi:hypothetical protein
MELAFFLIERLAFHSTAANHLWYPFLQRMLHSFMGCSNLIVQINTNIELEVNYNFLLVVHNQLAR